MREVRWRLISSIQVPRCAAAHVVAVPTPPLTAALANARSAFFGLCVHTGQQVLAAMMEAERTELRGPKGRSDPQRRAVRGGHAQSRITLGGRGLAMRRPRVRSVQVEELHLTS